MNRNQWMAAAAFLAALSSTAAAQATTIFSDNFDADGPADKLDVASLTKWNITSGSVDLIGQGGAFDLYPGNGFFVDLNGTADPAVPGTITTKTVFAPGTYQLTFDLGGSARAGLDPDSKTTLFTLGNFSQSLTLAPNDPLSLRSYSFTTTGGALSFGDLPGGTNQNIGNILDNVSVSAAPLPAALPLFASALAGLGLLVRRRKQRADAA